jgi:hypothetical protein
VGGQRNITLKKRRHNLLSLLRTRGRVTERDYLEDLGVDERKILTLILKGYGAYKLNELV